MKLRFAFLVAAALLPAALPALAFTPQTITIDGTNDFDPGNLLHDDTGDTQPGCTPPVLPMDLGRVYVTNDANFLYLGIEFARTCYCDMNLGIAIDVNSAGGGTTDPFGRRIGWLNVAFKPDWIVYDVTPTSCNSFNYEVLYQISGGSWINSSTLVNPGWGTGANDLGIADGLTFKELKLPLSVLGAAVGTPLHLELWVTQEGASKGPLDALASDDVQMSRGSSTTYDTTAVVQMTSMFTYTVLNAVDLSPPTVASVNAVGFTVLANKQFSLITNQIDVQFSEPVELATAQTATNYTFSGPVSRNVIGATRDAAATSLVHLTLNSAIAANAGAYQIAVANVQDNAANTIVANGTTNVGGFFIQNLVFNADMSLPLCAGTFAPPDTFGVEGSLAPLTFSLCDNARMTDANADSVYSVTVPFTLARDPGTGIGTANLEWKLTAKCNTWEPIPGGGNRVYALNSGNGASVALNVAWGDEDPSNYTTQAVDVIFQVDASRFGPTGSDVITLGGSALPLSFTQPGLPMLDDGVAPDLAAGDDIYTARVTFPACAPKNIGWKVDFNGVYECTGQGDRGLVLDQDLYSTSVPQVLPARGIDRCNVIDKPVTVLFRVDMGEFDPLPVDPEVVAVMGNQLPLRFDTPDPVARLLNDGTFPDAAANDVFFGRAITFPDSTPFTVEYKYWKDGMFECEGSGNRSLRLDDVAYSTGVPQVALGNRWNVCLDVTSAPPPAGAGTAFASLRPVTPNPVVEGARFSFTLFRAGHVALRVYDVSGRRVATVLDRPLGAGAHTLAWDGRAEDGSRLRSGIYLYELALDGQRAARRMVMAR